MFNGVWRSLVARFVRDEEAVGSNPATPTMTPRGDLRLRQQVPSDISLAEQPTRSLLVERAIDERMVA